MCKYLLGKTERKFQEIMNIVCGCRVELHETKNVLHHPKFSLSFVDQLKWPEIMSEKLVTPSINHKQKTAAEF